MRGSRLERGLASAADICWLTGWDGPEGQAKADSQRDYGGANAGDISLLHHLMRAHNKETGAHSTAIPHPLPQIPTK